MLKVEDTGIGIAEDKRDNILDAFTQGDGSFSRQFGGLGIGLSLVNALCTQLGGNIFISSELNYGTLVELSLPIEVPHQSLSNNQDDEENAEGWNRWGWQDGRTEKEKTEIWKDYQEVFSNILPKTVANLNAEIVYDLSLIHI